MQAKLVTAEVVVLRTCLEGEVTGEGLDDDRSGGVLVFGWVMTGALFFQHDRSSVN